MCMSYGYPVFPPQNGQAVHTAVAPMPTTQDPLKRTQNIIRANIDNLTVQDFVKDSTIFTGDLDKYAIFHMIITKHARITSAIERCINRIHHSSSVRTTTPPKIPAVTTNINVRNVSGNFGVHAQVSCILNAIHFILHHLIKI